MDWVEFKNYLSQVTDLSQGALHVYAAVLLQIGAAALFRRPLASLLPWLLVLAVLLVNEAADLRHPGRPVEEWQVLGGIKDLWNTMMVPTLLMMICRFAPNLMVGASIQPDGPRLLPLQPRPRNDVG